MFRCLCLCKLAHTCPLSHVAILIHSYSFANSKGHKKHSGMERRTSSIATGRSASEAGTFNTVVSENGSIPVCRPLRWHPSSWNIGHFGQVNPPLRTAGEVLSDESNGIVMEDDQNTERKITSSNKESVDDGGVEHRRQSWPSQESRVAKSMGPDTGLKGHQLGNRDDESSAKNGVCTTGEVELSFDLDDMADISIHLGKPEPQMPLPLHLPASGRQSNGLLHRPMRSLTINRRSLESLAGGSGELTLKGTQQGSWSKAGLHGGRGRAGLPEIKLDLGAVQRARDMSEPTELQLRRDKFAYFEKACSRVLEHVYLGSDAVARNLDTLRSAGITHVLNCVGYVCPEHFPDELAYKTLWLQDTPGEDITSVLYDVFDYLEHVRTLGGRVFVHCCQGVSRSTSLVIAYLMWLQGRSFEDAFRYVKEARGVTNPNMGFACQLLQWQKRLQRGESPGSPRARLYRMAPHSPYDPLHLVPKPLPKAGKAGLDPRGAFVLQAGPTVYSWQGWKSDEVSSAAADLAAEQIVRYEKLEGPVVYAREGEEGPGFWEALDQASSTSESFHATLSLEEDEPAISKGDAGEGENMAGKPRGWAGEEARKEVSGGGAGSGSKTGRNGSLEEEGSSDRDTGMRMCRQDGAAGAAASGKEQAQAGLDDGKNSVGGWPRSRPEVASWTDTSAEGETEGQRQSARSLGEDKDNGEADNWSRSLGPEHMKRESDGKEGRPEVWCGYSLPNRRPAWDSVDSMEHTSEGEIAECNLRKETGQEWNAVRQMGESFSCGRLPSGDRQGDPCANRERKTRGGGLSLPEVHAYNADFEAIAKARRGEAPRPEAGLGGSSALLPARSSGWGPRHRLAGTSAPSSSSARSPATAPGPASTAGPGSPSWPCSHG